MELKVDSKKELNNKVQIPMLGLGVYLISRGDETVNAVKTAIETGYRHVDTASMYGNEFEVGQAVRECGIVREEIFVTTKLWNSDHGYEKSLRAFDESMERLGLEYVDLYLIHWPVTALRKESWRALETIYKEGRAKAIGVSNYTIRHLEELLDYCEIAPAVNQVEFHPYLYQKGLLEFCRSNDICLEAYSPLTKGTKLDDAPLVAISNRYSKSPAQILIRWALQHDAVVLPKSANPDRIRENAEVFDFVISDDDMQSLNSFNQDWHVTWDPTEEP